MSPATPARRGPAPVEAPPPTAAPPRSRAAARAGPGPPGRGTAAGRAAGALALLLLVGAGAALRLHAARPAPTTFDEVSFTLALERFDLLAFEPHAPGYPLTVVLARAARALGAEAPYAAVAAALGALAAAAAWASAGGRAGGLAAGALVAFAPLGVLEAGRPLADATASALAALGLAAAWRAAGAPGLPRAPIGGAPRGAPPTGLPWPALSGLGLGLAIAAKPDLLPFAPAALLACGRGPDAARRRAAAAAGLALPCAAAVVALAQATGAGPLLAEAWRFARGHALDWGGGVGAPGASGGLERPWHAARPLLGALGAQDLPGLLASAALLGGLALRAPRAARRAVACACLPYALWVVLGQNLANQRHTLPLLAPGALLVGLGAAALARPGRPSRLPAARRALPAAAAAALVVAPLGASAAALTARARDGHPYDALVAWLAAQDALEVRVYAGATGRPLRRSLPGHDVRRVRSVAEARAALEADPWPPRRVLVLDEVPGAALLPRRWTGEGHSVRALVPLPSGPTFADRPPCTRSSAARSR